MVSRFLHLICVAIGMRKDKKFGSCEMQNPKSFGVGGGANVPHHIIETTRSAGR
jgi:hypothetical protein